MSGTDLPQKISDEEMDELVKLFRAGHAAAPVPSTPDERVRAGLAAALVASGYRREVDVLREAYLAIRGHAAAYRAVPALKKLREAYEAGGRRDPEIRRQIAVHEWYARGLEAAARDIAERLGVPEHEIEQATALEQAQPLLAAGSEVESLEPRRCPSGIHSTQGESPECWCTPVAPAEGQERSEEKEHG